MAPAAARVSFVQCIHVREGFRDTSTLGGSVDGWVRLGTLADAPGPGAMRAFPIGDGTVVVVARLQDGSLAAFDVMCTHEECPLSEGELEGDHVVCYCHSGEFDVLTGAVVKGPPEDSIPVYPIRAFDGELQVQLLSTVE